MNVMESAVEETGDDAPAAVWFMERVCVQLKSNNAQAVIKQKINGSQALVELEDKSTLTVQHREVTMVPPQEHDLVLVVGGAEDVGVEGELVCIDGADAILKESDENFKIVDFVHLAKIQMDGIEFIRTFHTGNYDNTFNEALSSDRSVIFTTRATQASYNMPDNWRERNRIGLEKVKRQIQSCIYSVSGHDKNLDLHLIHNDVDEYIIGNDEPIVWHEPILDRSWDELKAAIDRRKKDIVKIRGIQIENVEMKKERLAALFAIFLNGSVNNSSTIFDFDNANLCEEGIIHLSNLVEASPELRCFSLRHNRIDSMESAQCLSRSIRSHTRVNQLDLSHCNLGSSPEILMVILQSDVKHLNLNNNNIDSLGAIKIAEYLEDDPPIELFFLDRNRLNDNDAILISQALKRNTNLKTLALHTNSLTSIGVKSLITCGFDSSSLNSLSESNHTLRGMNLYDYKPSGVVRTARTQYLTPYTNILQCCINRLLGLDKTQKMLLAMKGKDSLIQYLANVPVDLMPEVLALPLLQYANGHQHEHKHLNIVYSTMRWWNMPLLYSYHNCVKSDAKRKRDK
jgi:hypothetical protein